jgi:lysophospholipase L1-like esterase
MKTDKIIVFFVVLAMLFWNPVSYYILYSQTPIYDSNAIKLAFWTVFILCILLMYLIKKGYTNKTTINLIFTFSFTSLIFGLIVIINLGLGFLLPSNKLNKNDINIGIQKKEGLIFEPNSKASYKTIEFDYTANINSLGLRDKEIAIDKGDNYRVLCFGDSWTFGWGVEVENSWPKQLESFLVAKGFRNIEIINCGQGGQFTSTYKKYMEKAIPLLKPDLVLVGVLQLDDLAQLYENNFNDFNEIPNTSNKPQPSFLSKSVFVIKNFIKSSTGNIVTIIKNKNKPKIVEVKTNWEISSLNLINSFNHLQKIRFYSLNDSVQNMFRTGNLNPGLLNYYINFTDRITIFNNPSHKSTLFAISEMKKDIKSMLEICSLNNSKMIFINMPTNIFTGHNVNRTPSDILNNYFMENNKIDSIYQSIAHENNLPYIELTRHFIDLEDKNKYFFKYDGHPNEIGYNEIAKYIGDQLIENKIIIKK